MKLPESPTLRGAMVTGVWALAVLGVIGANKPCTVATVLHRPCPGCGLTRATMLLLHGDWRASLAMHPLAVPIIACWAAIAIATITSTLRDGVPWFFHTRRLGKLAVIATGVAYVALVVLWGLRERGFFGGPVPV
jgi:hypothetical protein